MQPYEWVSGMGCELVHAVAAVSKLRPALPDGVTAEVVQLGRVLQGIHGRAEDLGFSQLELVSHVDQQLLGLALP
jgi:hypothetical protein